MFGAVLKILEDPKQPLLGPTLSSLRFSGLLLSKNPIRRFPQLVLPASHFIFLLTQFIEAYVLRDDLGLLLTNLKIAALGLTLFLKVFCFIFFQKTWCKIFDYVNEADQFERDTQNEVRKEIIDKYTKFSRKTTYIYWLVMFNNCLCVILRSVVLFSIPAYRDEMQNGTAPFPHIFSSWTPFDKETSPGCWFLMVWQYSQAIYGTFILAAYDAGVAVLIVFFGGKLDLMRERCKDLFGRGEELSEGECRANLRLLHSMHVELIKNCRRVNSLISPVMFLYTSMCTIMICSSLFQLAAETQPLQKFLLAQYLLFAVAQLFIVCWTSNNCLGKSEEVSKGPYESEWWKSTVTVRQKKDVLMLCGQLQQSYTFTAGPFVDLNLPTFVSILKGAYSFFTILRE